MLQQRTAELDCTTRQLQLKNQELEKRGRELEEANRLKTEFMSNISHELRTPLNSIMALSRVLKNKARSRGTIEEAEHLDTIERNGGHLLGLIDDILDLARIESGRLDLKPSRLSVGSVVESVMENVEPIAAEKGLCLDLDVSADLPGVVTDEKCLHQILLNLIGNAVKFTREGHVGITAATGDETVLISVSDTGVGIAEGDLPHVFEKFWQADASLASDHDGVGLGLTIAFETARLLGGELTARSEKGKGSTFTLRLPIQWPEKAVMAEPVSGLVE